MSRERASLVALLRLLPPLGDGLEAMMFSGWLGVGAVDNSTNVS